MMRLAKQVVVTATREKKQQPVCEKQLVEVRLAAGDNSPHLRVSYQIWPRRMIRMCHPCTDCVGAVW